MSQPPYPPHGRHHQYPPQQGHGAPGPRPHSYPHPAAPWHEQTVRHAPIPPTQPQQLRPTPAAAHAAAPARPRWKPWHRRVMWGIGSFFAFVLAISVLGQPATSDTAGIAGAELPAAAQAPDAQPADQPQAPAAASEPPPTPIVHEGSGDDVITLDKPAGVAVLDFECPKCSRNVIVQTDGRDSLLVNTIGAYTGRHLIDTSDTARTSTLEIQARGSWKVTVTPGLSALRSTAGEPISGSGDDVVALTGSTTKALITNRGERNFIVQVVGGWMTDLAINEIGSYEGTVRLDAPAVVMVKSSGDWTIMPS